MRFPRVIGHFGRGKIGSLTDPRVPRVTALRSDKISLQPCVTAFHSASHFVSRRERFGNNQFHRCAIHWSSTKASPHCSAARQFLQNVFSRRDRIVPCNDRTRIEQLDFQSTQHQPVNTFTATTNFAVSRIVHIILSWPNQIRTIVTCSITRRVFI